MKKMNRFVSCAAAMSLALASLPTVTASAEAAADVVTVTSATDLSNITAGKTYKLDSDLVLTSGITVSAANVTLDLNGHKLTDNTGSGCGITINGGSLVIQDSSAAGTGMIYRENGSGTMYLINVTGTNSVLTFKSGKLLNEYAGSLTVINVTPSCTLNVEGGELKSTTGSTLIKLDDGNGELVTFNMTGGTLISDSSKGGCAPSLPIPNGTDPNGDGTSYAGAIINFGKANIGGGTVKGVVWANSYKYASEVNISGDANIEGYLHIGSDQDGKDKTPTVNISGGELNVSILEVDAVDPSNSLLDGEGTLNITGGKVNVAKFILPEAAEGDEPIEPKITVDIDESAEFTTKDVTNAEKFLPEGMGFVENEDGTFGAAKEYTVTKDTEVENGTLEISPEGKAPAGETVTVTAAPASGYELEAVTVKQADGTAVEVKDGKFTMPAGNVTVSATFKKTTVTPNPGSTATKKYEVKTPSIAGSHGNWAASPYEVAEGTVVTLTAFPDEGYELEAFIVKNDTTGEEVKVTDGKFTMPASDVTVSATFKKTADDGDEKPADGDKTDSDKTDNSKTDDNKTDGNKTDGSDQKPTGIALAAAPVILAAGAVAVVTVNKKRK